MRFDLFFQELQALLERHRATITPEIDWGMPEFDGFTIKLEAPDTWSGYRTITAKELTAETVREAATL